MLKFSSSALLMVLAIGVGSQSVMAQEDMVSSEQPVKKVIHSMNGSSGFVFNKLKGVSEVKSQGFDLLIVDSSKDVSESQLKEIQDQIEKGIAVVIDAGAGTGTAKKVSEDLIGFGIDSEAIMIVKSTDSKGGYVVTPITSATKPANTGTANAQLDSSDVTNKQGTAVSNTISDIFGI